VGCWRPGWLNKSALEFFSSPSFSLATAMCPLPTHWDLPVEEWLLPTSGQLSTSATKERCVNRSFSHNNGVVPILDTSVGDDVPLRLDDDRLWVDCTLA
jgi:hypothetical protein